MDSATRGLIVFSVLAGVSGPQLAAANPPSDWFVPAEAFTPAGTNTPMPVFTPRQALAETINFLTQPSLKGRELGTPELDQVSDYLAAQFRDAGLQPAGDDAGSYFQTWTEALEAPKGPTTLKNIIGIIPGKNPAFAGQSVVIGAHYDHLGRGWPDVHRGDEGKIHPGADDNASGIAILLELARSGMQPARTVIFVAFSGEEAKLLGSSHFVKAYSNGNILAMINLDTVGRLGANKLAIFGIGSAKEWGDVFQGAGDVTHVPLELILMDIGASDQKSFLDAGIPAVQFFSGANSDYHRPSDAPDKLDYAGMIKVAAVAKEVIDYLAEAKEPLTSTLTPGNPPPDDPRTHTQKKVSLGIVPDYAFTGTGVRVSGVGASSPAGKAGIIEGDIILQMNETMIQDLRAMSVFLKTIQAGDLVKIRVSRSGADVTVTATAVER
ncbi:MAG: M20/M25/M40 family metallo-hydrolase [Elusimicrobiota bacterium]